MYYIIPQSGCTNYESYENTKYEKIRQEGGFLFHFIIHAR